jgi:hypothetical protein
MRALVVAALLTTAFAVPAQANPLPTGPVGAKCAFNSTTDVTREAGWQIGEWRAGPLVTAEGGTLQCDIVVNGVVAAPPVSAGAVAGAVVVIPPTPLSYQATAADEILLCTTWHGASGDLYWHEPSSVLPGFWDSTPGNCSGPTSIEPNDPECSIWKAIDRRAGTNIAEIWQGCESYSELPVGVPSVAPQCSDGVDNDLDGRTDYPDDPDCTSPSGALEAGAPGTSCPDVSVLVPVCVSYTPGTTRTPYTVYAPTTAGGSVVAHVDRYQFTLPNGATTAVPCVVVDGTPDACSAAGGTYLDTMAALGPALSTPVTTVYVCDANLVATADDLGLTSFPAYALC